jgi:hypothetical protein
MQIISIFCGILKLVSATLIVTAILSGAVSLVALVSRFQHGRGILFADVEFFLFIAVLCGLPGAILFLGAGKLSKVKRNN